ncbi:hypothetical protein KS4_17030 [Poriferisphaera corsica]|uniref:Uncharacterized protein n=1 Tax=Poriferisphaera corsica TaxID=2528020 RepID=A0A517YTV5_9BACT|nr:hypothetical protein [Poriferisphaera corsica]QDU33647.1 hypothetical protein KS4_17030 [Poriferisphaera corsica]
MKLILVDEKRDVEEIDQDERALRASPQSVTWWVLFLWSWVRPRYAADRASVMHGSGGRLRLLPLVVLSTGILVFIGMCFSDWPRGYFSLDEERSLWRFLAFMPELFQHNVSTGLPFLGKFDAPILISLLGIVSFGLLSLPCVWGIGLLLVCRVAKVGDERGFLEIWGEANRRVAGVLPCISLMICVGVFLINYPYIATHQHFLSWHQMHQEPWRVFSQKTATLNKKVQAAGGRYTTAQYAELGTLREEKDAYRAQYMAEREVHLAKGGVLIQYHEIIEASMVLPIIFGPLMVLLIGVKGRYFREAWPWPGYCDECGYQVFLEKVNDEAKVCGECGKHVCDSLPPIHRIGLPMDGARIARPIDCVRRYLKTAWMFLFEVKRVGRLMRTRVVNEMHHWFMLSSILIAIVLSLMAMNIYMWYYFFDEGGRGFRHSLDAKMQLVWEGVWGIVIGAGLLLVGWQMWWPWVLNGVFGLFGARGQLGLGYKVSCYVWGSVVLLFALTAVPMGFWVGMELEWPWLLGWFAERGGKVVFGSFVINRSVLPVILIGCYVSVVLIWGLIANVRLIRKLRWANA